MNREQFNAKCHLSRVKTLKAQIHVQMISLEELEAYINSISSMPATEKVTGGCDKAELYNKKLTEYLDRKDKFVKKIDKLNKEIKEIEGLVNSISDEKIKAILNLRYIGCLTWEDVGKEMNYTERQLRNMHLKGLTSISKLLF